MTGQKQLFDHIEDEQSLHALKGYAVPELRRGKEDQGARMAKDKLRADVCIRPACNCCHGAPHAVRHYNIVPLKFISEGALEWARQVRGGSAISVYARR